MTTQTPPTVHLTGPFTVDTWRQEAVDEDDGAAIARAHVVKTFSGDLAGTSTTDLLLARTPSGPAAYVGLERFTGSVQGREGSFVLRHDALSDGDEHWLTWVVLPGSGTGALTGVRGEGQIDVADDGAHSYRLDLAFAPPA